MTIASGVGGGDPRVTPSRVYFGIGGTTTVLMGWTLMPAGYA